MRKFIVTSAVLLSTAIGAATFAYADKAPSGDREARYTAMCTDRTARAAGELTYLETKLKPTAAQTAEWDAFKDAMTAQAKTAEANCLDRAAQMKQRFEKKERPSVVERQAMMEKVLEAKLAGIKATQPALTKLYSSLDDSQKQTLDRAARHMFGERHHRFAEGRKHHDGWKNKARYERNDDMKKAPEAPVEQ